MSPPIYRREDRTEALNVSQQYGKRPQDGLIVSVRQRTTGTGRSVLLRPVDVAELAQALEQWLEEAT